MNPVRKKHLCVQRQCSSHNADYVDACALWHFPLRGREKWKSKPIRSNISRYFHSALNIKTSLTHTIFADARKFDSIASAVHYNLYCHRSRTRSHHNNKTRFYYEWENSGAALELAIYGTPSKKLTIYVFFTSLSFVAISAFNWQ